MTMFALQRRATDCGITVSSLHPGMVYIVKKLFIMLCLMYICLIKVDTEIPRNYEDMRLTSLAVKVFMGLGNNEVIQKIFHVFQLYHMIPVTCIGLGRSPEKGAVTTINCAVNPALNSQQAVYYSSNSRPEQASETARQVASSLYLLKIQYFNLCTIKHVF